MFPQRDPGVRRVPSPVGERAQIKMFLAGVKSRQVGLDRSGSQRQCHGNFGTDLFVTVQLSCDDALL